MDPRARTLAIAALLAAACASPRSQAPPRGAPLRAPRILPRSSVAAVLAHRGELDLDDEQIRRLEALDQAFQDEHPAARAAPAAAAPAPPPGAPAAGPGRSPGGPGSPAGGPPPRAGRPQEDPGDRMGRPRGGHRGAPAERREAPAGRTWEDDDTACYLRAEELLRPEQRDRARAIAERYREDLYEERTAGRRAGAP